MAIFFTVMTDFPSIGRITVQSSQKLKKAKMCHDGIRQDAKTARRTSY